MFKIRPLIKKHNQQNHPPLNSTESCLIFHRMKNLFERFCLFSKDDQKFRIIWWLVWTEFVNNNKNGKKNPNGGREDRYRGIIGKTIKSITLPYGNMKGDYNTLRFRCYFHLPRDRRSFHVLASYHDDRDNHIDTIFNSNNDDENIDGHIP